MKRYTDRNVNGQAMLVLRNAVECMGEDVNRWNINKRPCGTTTVMGDAVDKFAEYEDAEEKGLLWQFPCKIGDVLYKPVTGMYRGNQRITEPCVEAVVVTKIQITSNEVVFSTKLNDMNHWRGDDFGLEEIGEAIFLTQEEAEEKAEEIAKELAERKE